MSMKHTPGPWCAYREGDRNSHYRDPFSYTIMRGASLRELQHTEPIAHCPTDRPQIALVSEYLHPVEANARLIAAAPDLLRELREILESVAMHSEHDGTCQRSDWTSVRAAIAKAEGP